MKNKYEICSENKNSYDAEVEKDYCNKNLDAPRPPPRRSGLSTRATLFKMLKGLEGAAFKNVDDEGFLPRWKKEFFSFGIERSGQNSRCWIFTTKKIRQLSSSSCKQSVETKNWWVYRVTKCPRNWKSLRLNLVVILTLFVADYCNVVFLSHLSTVQLPINLHIPPFFKLQYMVWFERYSVGRARRIKVELCRLWIIILHPNPDFYLRIMMKNMMIYSYPINFTWCLLPVLCKLFAFSGFHHRLRAIS